RPLVHNAVKYDHLFPRTDADSNCVEVLCLHSPTGITPESRLLPSFLFHVWPHESESASKDCSDSRLLRVRDSSILLAVFSMKLSGQSIIGFTDGAGTGVAFRARNPRTGEAISPDFFSASLHEVNRAAQLAGD